LMDPISKAFVAAIHAFAHAHGVPLLTFEKGQRKDAVMAERLRRLPRRRGWCSSGEPRRRPGVPDREAPEPDDGPGLSLARALDGDDQPLLLLCRGCGLRPLLPEVWHYFPYNAKLCLN